MLTGMKDKLLNNIKIQLTNLEVVYEDSISLGYPCVSRVFIKQIRLNTTNENWELDFNSENKLKNFRILNVEGLSFSLYCEQPTDS